jgi:hypothetical protein
MLRRVIGSNDRNDISSLFSPDERYYTSPHREPWRDGGTIVAEWRNHKDEPGAWSFRHGRCWRSLKRSHFSRLDERSAAYL